MAHFLFYTTSQDKIESNTKRSTHIKFHLLWYKSFPQQAEKTNYSMNIIFYLYLLFFLIPSCLAVTKHKKSHSNEQQDRHEDSRHLNRLRKRIEPMNPWKDENIIVNRNLSKLSSPEIVPNDFKRHKVDSSFYAAGNRNIQNLPAADDALLSRHSHAAPRWIFD